jgi:hypothetical protein
VCVRDRAQKAKKRLRALSGLSFSAPLTIGAAHLCLRAQLHKVGGTTLRGVLLRAAAAANGTVGTLGCGAQREPLRAHLSASHVVCPGPTRCVTLQLR